MAPKKLPSEIPSNMRIVQVGGETYLQKKRRGRKKGISRAQKNAIKRGLRRPSLILGGSVALNALDSIDKGMKAGGTTAHKAKVALDDFQMAYTGYSRAKGDWKLERMYSGWVPILIFAVAGKLGLTRRLGQAMKGLPFRA